MCDVSTANGEDYEDVEVFHNFPGGYISDFLTWL